jgi:chromosome segregation ATPase
VVHPRRGDRELIEPKSNVKLTDSAYRVSVPFDGSDLEVTIEERQVTGQTFALASMSEDQLVFYASSRAIEPDVATVLREIADLRRTVAERQRRVTRLERDLSALYREQERVRANLEVLSREDDVYQTFLQRLSRQEEAIDGVSRELAAANEALAEAQDDLAEYLGSL